MEIELDNKTIKRIGTLHKKGGVHEDSDFVQKVADTIRGAEGNLLALNFKDYIIIQFEEEEVSNFYEEMVTYQRNGPPYSGYDRHLKNLVCTRSAIEYAEEHVDALFSETDNLHEQTQEAIETTPVETFYEVYRYIGHRLLDSSEFTLPLSSTGEKIEDKFGFKTDNHVGNRICRDLCIDVYPDYDNAKIEGLETPGDTDPVNNVEKSN